MKKEPFLQMDVTYRKKPVRIQLLFSEEQSDKNARQFYDNLIKLYLEQDEFRAQGQETSVF